ncbi:hypothetical protein JHD49_03790 [Sulfurimonas sp. SAG-AH-194-C21]|nr:hypothetical protein [Sulfurimonas sp. SAG-AH-194-C21]MDF1883053.1 hypothetical protein [Sulfurimonas sp. SAG-AH-194-C21]
MKFRRQGKTVFIDSKYDASIEYEKGKKLDIILSPSLYWVKKISLPVKSVSQANKLLASIFEDSLPLGHYSYVAYKNGDDFLVFAYEDKKILSLLNTKNISLGDVNSIHFAQHEFKTLEGALKVNATQSMYLKDSLLVLAPSAWLSDSKELDLRDIKLSKHSIKLQQFGHIVDKKSLYKVGVILVLFALILIVEIFVATSKKDALQTLQEEVFAKHKLQSTMFQNNSTKRKYESIHKTQTKLRQYTSYFLKMKLHETQKIMLIEYKNKILYVRLSGVSKGSSKSITSQLDSKSVKYKVSYSDESMKVEIKI